MIDHCPYCGLGLDQIETLLRQELAAYPALVERIISILAQQLKKEGS